jgi:hypothetical protein
LGLVHNGVAAAADGCVGAGVPYTVDFNSALNRTNPEGNLVLSLHAHSSHWLCLEHLRRLYLLALVDFAVLAELLAVVP